MNKTIIFFTVYPFNNHYKIQYGLEYLKNKGFNIVIVNIIKLIYPHALEKLPHYLKIDESLNIKQINADSMKNIEDIVVNTTTKTFVIFICSTKKNILTILQRHKIGYLLIDIDTHNLLIYMTLRIRIIKFLIEILSPIFKKTKYGLFLRKLILKE